MALTALGLLIVIGVVVKVMTGEERAHTSRNVIEFLKELKHAARRRPEEQVLHDALNERSRWPFVTLALVGLNAVIFLGILFGAGSLSNPQTLIGWGGSIGPRTTNGEWWRVGTSLFVHAGLFQLVVVTGALLQVGWLLERLVGHATLPRPTSRRESSRVSSICRRIVRRWDSAPRERCSASTAFCWPS